MLVILDFSVFYVMQDIPNNVVMLSVNLTLIISTPTHQDLTSGKAIKINSAYLSNSHGNCYITTRELFTVFSTNSKKANVNLR